MPEGTEREQCLCTRGEEIVNVFGNGAAAASVLPARMSLFFRRSICFTAGVTYGGSLEAMVTVRFG